MIPSGIRPPVVVGIDDTDADGDAVDRAAAQARTTHTSPRAGATSRPDRAALHPIRAPASMRR